MTEIAIDETLSHSEERYKCNIQQDGATQAHLIRPVLMRLMYDSCTLASFAFMIFSSSLSSVFLVWRASSSSSHVATLTFLFSLYFLHLITFLRFCSGISSSSACLGPLVCLLGPFGTFSAARLGLAWIISG